MLPRVKVHEMVEFSIEIDKGSVNFAVKVVGNSMAPLLCNGDILLVSKKRWVRHKELGIFLIDGKMYAELYYSKGNNCRLISLDLDINSIVLSPENLHKVTCLGAVVKILHPGEYKIHEE